MVAKKKVLCLHGYGQSAKIFREKTGSFRKFLNKYIEFDVIDAHFLIEGEFAEDGVSPIYRWWVTPEVLGTEYLTSSECVGIEESVSFLLDYLSENEYDGIIGFSQGGVLLSVIIAILSDPEHPKITPEKRQKILQRFKFAMIFSAFPNPYFHETLQKLDLSRDDFNVNVLFVAGTKDEIVPINYSISLAKLFKAQFLPEIEERPSVPSLTYAKNNKNNKVEADPELFSPPNAKAFLFLHPGSHYVPLNHKAKIVYLSYIHHLSKL